MGRSFHHQKNLGIIVGKDSEHIKDEIGVGWKHSLVESAKSYVRDWRFTSMLACFVLFMIISLAIVRKYEFKKSTSIYLIDAAAAADDDTHDDNANNNNQIDDEMKLFSLNSNPPCSLNLAFLRSKKIGGQTTNCSGVFITRKFALFQADCNELTRASLLNLQVLVAGSTNESIDVSHMWNIGNDQTIKLVELTRAKSTKGSVCFTNQTFISDISILLESGSILNGSYCGFETSNNTLRSLKLVNSGCPDLPRLLRAQPRTNSIQRRVFFSFNGDRSSTSQDIMYLNGIYSKANDSRNDEFIYIGKYLNEIRDRLEAARSRFEVDRERFNEFSNRSRSHPTSTSKFSTQTSTTQNMTSFTSTTTTTTTTTRKRKSSSLSSVTSFATSRVTRANTRYSREANYSYGLNLGACAEPVLVPITYNSSLKVPLCTGVLITAVFVVYPVVCLRRGNASAYTVEMPYFRRSTNSFIMVSHAILDTHVYEFENMAILRAQLQPMHTYYDTTCILPDNLVNNNNNVTNISLRSGQGHHKSGTYYFDWTILPSAQDCQYDPRLKEIIVANSDNINCSALPIELRRAINESYYPLFDKKQFFSIANYSGKKYLNGLYTMGDQPSRDVFLTFRGSLFAGIQAALERKRYEDFKLPQI